VEQQAEKRMTAYAGDQPEARVRYQHRSHDGHKDEPALVVLGSLLSGKDRVVSTKPRARSEDPNNAMAGQNGRKWEGYFMLNAVAKPEDTPEQGRAGTLQGTREAPEREVPDPRSCRR